MVETVTSSVEELPDSAPDSVVTVEEVLVEEVSIDGMCGVY
jgi:mycofactocin precursor